MRASLEFMKSHLSIEEQEFVRNKMETITDCCCSLVEMLEQKFNINDVDQTISVTVLQFSDALNHLQTISSQVKSRKMPVNDQRRQGTEMNVLELGLTMEGPK